MRLSRNNLLLVCNPFCAPLSVRGEAMALCAVDPREPMGRLYIGATTRAISAPIDARRHSSFGVRVSGGGTARLTRDKVRVTYDLLPVEVPDTSYYRRAIVAGEVIDISAEVTAGAPGSLALLRSAARAALAAWGGDRTVALTAWRGQGLGHVADLVSMRCSRKLPPAGEAGAGTELDPSVHAVDGGAS